MVGQQMGLVEVEWMMDGKDKKGLITTSSGS